MRFVFIAAALVAALYACSSSLFAPSYSSTVDRPPEAVFSALGRLNVEGQPGSPGSDPSLSGGVASEFKAERLSNSVIWRVWNGNEVATTVTITVEPLDGGKRSKVTAFAERGEAPDEITAPAFRSTGVTMGLFAMAIDEKLSAMTAVRAPGTASPEFCRQLFARLTGTSADGIPEPGQLKSGIGAIASLHSAYPVMRRQGCVPDSNDSEFREVSNEMK